MKGVSIKVEKSDTDRAEAGYLEQIAALKEEIRSLEDDVQCLSAEVRNVRDDRASLRSKYNTLTRAIHVLSVGIPRSIFNFMEEEANEAMSRAAERARRRSAGISTRSSWTTPTGSGDEEA